MKRNFILGLIYGIIWFCVINLFFYLDLNLPIVEWTQAQYEAGNYSENVIILGFRSMWGLEFLMHAIVSAMIASLFIVKYHNDASNSDLVKISLVCVVLFSIILFTSVPRFIPFYIGVTIQIASLIICLLFSVRCTKYITSKLSRDC